MAGSVQRQKVYVAGQGVVPVGEGIASGLDPARKPRESPPNRSALYTVGFSEEDQESQTTVVELR